MGECALQCSSNVCDLPVASLHASLRLSESVPVLDMVLDLVDSTNKKTN